MPPSTLNYSRKFWTELRPEPPRASKMAAGALVAVLVSYPLGLYAGGGAMILSFMLSIAALVRIYRSRRALSGLLYAWLATALSAIWLAVMGAFMVVVTHFGPHPT